MLSTLTVFPNKKSSNLVIDDKLIRPEESLKLIGDNSKMLNMGWKPEITFDEMVKDMTLKDIKLIEDEENNISM